MDEKTQMERMIKLMRDVFANTEYIKEQNQAIANKLALTNFNIETLNVNA